MWNLGRSGWKGQSVLKFGNRWKTDFVVAGPSNLATHSCVISSHTVPGPTVWLRQVQYHLPCPSAQRCARLCAAHGARCRIWIHNQSTQLVEYKARWWKSNNYVLFKYNINVPCKYCTDIIPRLRVDLPCFWVGTASVARPLLAWARHVLPRRKLFSWTRYWCVCTS